MKCFCAPVNLLSQIANLSHPPPESTFITYSNSNNNTDGFVSARRRRTVNLNKNTTSKQKHSLPSGIGAVYHVTFHTAKMSKRTLRHSEVTLSLDLRRHMNYKAQYSTECKFGLLLHPRYTGPGQTGV